VSLSKSESNSYVIRNVLALVHDVADKSSSVYINSHHLTVSVDSYHSVSLWISNSGENPRISNSLSVNKVPICSFVNKEISKLGNNKYESVFVA